MKSLRVDGLLLCLYICWMWPHLAKAMQAILPTPTFAGLRAAQADVGIQPTSAPWRSEILKRLIGDPAICGWVEGKSSKRWKQRKDGQGYGCAAITGYNKQVLTTTSPGVTPFGQGMSTSLSSSLTGPGTIAQQASAAAIAPLPSSSPADMRLISGGAIAGAVAGSVLALAGIVGIFVFFRRRHRAKKEQERLAATRVSERSSSQYVYAQYAKPPPSTLSPPTSPPMHSRHPSDQTYGFPSSPPLSDDRPWSPEAVGPNGVAELGVGDEARKFQKP
ncbi:MAG: hypothetical protein Q9213_007534 [Squamulea squamosa]